jgi:LmbE family N-acetylglucosaminyl deacetylase
MMAQQTKKRTILAVFAHPDDEAFGTGGTLAKYAAEGHDVYLVTATRGEAGGIAEGMQANEADLPLVREHELRCACASYGIHEPIFLDYIDGQLPMVHQGQAVGKVVRIIRQLRPDVLISFGPDGIYGHYDHIAAHKWATIGAELATDSDCYPHQIAGICQPHRISKLYFRVLSEESVRQRADGGRPAVMMSGVPFHFVGYPAEQITTVIDVSAYAERKLNGIRCHATQIGAESVYFQEPGKALADPMFSAEQYILAESAVGMPDGVETDLLERLG